MRWALASLLLAASSAPSLAAAPSAPRALCAGTVVDPAAKGAWYRKIESVPDDVSVGVRGRVTLPRVVADPARQMPRRDGDPVWWEGPLDRPSVYLGVGAPGVEVDAGLSWERELDEAGEPALAADGSPAFAFRPFWRVFEHGAQTFGPPSGQPRPSFAPGEEVSLSVEVVGDGQLVLTVKGAGGEDYATLVPVPGLPRDAAGRPRSFKRVNAIDQYRWDGTTHKGNEGRAALPTRAAALGSRWATASLLRPGGAFKPLAGAACRVSVGAERAASLPPAVRAADPTPDGGETIDLRPSQ